MRSVSGAQALRLILRQVIVSGVIEITFTMFMAGNSSRRNFDGPGTGTSARTLLEEGAREFGSGGSGKARSTAGKIVQRS